MKIKFHLLLFTCILSLKGYAQSIILDKGFDDLILGISESKLDDIVGFQGKAVTYEEYFTSEISDRKKETLPEYKNGFDKCILYKHIMPVPVTKVMIKGGKVNMVEINSFADFTKPICLDSKTKEGLKFWDSKDVMEKIYGKNYRIADSPKSNMNYYYYDSKRIGFGLTNNEVRVIYYY